VEVVGSGHERGATVQAPSWTTHGADHLDRRRTPDPGAMGPAAHQEPGTGVALPDRAGLRRRALQPSCRRPAGVHAATVASGAAGSPPAGWKGWRTSRGRGARSITDAQVERVIVKTLEETWADATHWSTRSMARATGMSQTAVSRIWRALGSSRTWSRAGSCRVIRSSSVRSATSVGCISTRRRRRWCWAWTSSPSSRRWTAPPRCCR
jgi:hypothetical protein